MFPLDREHLAQELRTTKTLRRRTRSELSVSSDQTITTQLVCINNVRNFFECMELHHYDFRIVVVYGLLWN